MESTKKTAIIVGITMMVSLVIFLSILSFLARWNLGEKGFKVNLKFNFLNNLSLGAPVKIAGGIKIGFVDEIYQKELQTFVRIYINERLRNKIPRNPDTQFAIFTNGVNRA